MRGIATRVVGTGVAAGTLFAISRSCCGCIAAFSLLLATFTIVIGVGLSVDGVLGYREDRSHRVRELPCGPLDGPCHCCGGRMICTGGCNLCPVCDTAPPIGINRRRRSTWFR